MEDRQNGFVQSLSWEGRQQVFPLLKISGAILRKEAGHPMPALDDLSALIAHAKKAAKKSKDALVCIDTSDCACILRLSPVEEIGRAHV